MIYLLKSKTDAGHIFFYCPGTVPLWRALTLFTKEPETIDWIDSFESDFVFWDIGANVGIYSLYAAQKEKAKILSFEPGAANYYVLNKNIEINHVDDKITAYCLSFSDETITGNFYMINTSPGDALNTFRYAESAIGDLTKISFRQGSIGYSIDNFIEAFNPPFPNHIKVDVDGIEKNIILGAKKTLHDYRLKSILIEIDADKQNDFDQIIDIILQAGFRAQFVLDVPSTTNDTTETVANFIFRR